MSLALELGYCIFIWPKQTRAIWIAGIVGLHIGIMIFLGLHLFGLIMVCLTVCLFAVPADVTEKNTEDSRFDDIIVRCAAEVRQIASI